MKNLSNSRGICEKALLLQMNRNLRRNGPRHPYLTELDERFYKSLDFIKLRPKKAFSIDMFPSLDKKPSSGFFKNTVWTQGSFMISGFKPQGKREQIKLLLKNLLSFAVRKKIIFPGLENRYSFKGSTFDYIEVLGAITWSDNTISLLNEVNRLLVPGSFFGFTSFGPETLKTFIFSLANETNSCQKESFIPLVDLHDIGDFCVAAGFVSPVVASDRVFFKYKKAETALRELRLLSGNPFSTRSKFLRGKKWYRSIINALNGCRDKNGLVTLEFELIYGHAWKVSRSVKSDKSEASTKFIEKKIKFSR